MSGTRAEVPLHRKVMLGLVLGVVAGALANRYAPKATVQLLSDVVAHPIGQIFFRLLFMVVVPLVFATLVNAVASLDNLRHVGRMGVRTLLFFLLTTTFSALLGWALVRGLQPGVGFEPELRESLRTAFGADAARMATQAAASAERSTLDTVNAVLDMVLPRNVLQAVIEMSMLPVIVFALFCGAALTRVADERRRAMTAWLATLGDVMVEIVGFALKLAPYAVFCLIFAVIAKFGLELLEKLAFYVLIVLGGYVLQLFVMNPILVATLARRRPLEFLRTCIPVMVTALSTSSSSATLPTALRVAERDLGLRPSVVGFVVPLGSTLNRNGSALFGVCVVLFTAQIFGVELSLAQQMLVVVLCVLVAIAAAGIPSGALPLLMGVMSQFGIPPDGIAIILGVDRLLDMGRTVVNVMDDLVCAAYIDRVESGRDRS